jgi:hypothetical protein
MWLAPGRTHTHERRLDELMKAQAATVGKAKGGGDKRSDHRGKHSPSGPPSLAEAGIDKDLAARSAAGRAGRDLGGRRRRVAVELERHQRADLPAC